MAAPVDKKQRACPSCGFRMLGGKFCPECGAELVDEQTMRPSDSYTDELVERTAARTVELLRKGMSNGNQTEQNENSNPGGSSASSGSSAGSSGGREEGPGQTPETPEPKKRSGFFGRGR